MCKVSSYTKVLIKAQAEQEANRSWWKPKYEDGFCWLKLIKCRKSKLRAKFGPFPKLIDFYIYMYTFEPKNLRDGTGISLKLDKETETIHIFNSFSEDTIPYRVLVALHGDYKLGAFSAQDGVDIATAAGIAAIAQPTATSDFNMALKNTASVQTLLNPEQRRILEDLLGYRPRYLGTRANVGDHPIIAAYRELIREAFEHLYHVSTLKGTKLYVGAAGREIFSQRENLNSFFHLHASEGKDTDRLVTPVIEELLSLYEDHIKSSAHNMRRYKKSRKDRCMQELRQQFKDFESLISGLSNNSEYKDRFKFEIEGKYNYLIFEDSAYNFDQQDWYNAFLATNADVAYGYGFYPLEMQFGELTQNKLYYYSEEGDCARVAYYAGYSNGYVHNKNTWSLPMSTIAIPGEEFNLLFEITARIGPMAMFKVVRTQKALKEHRVISIPDKQRTLKILDFDKSIDFSTGKFRGLNYTNIRKDEFDVAVNYFDSLAENAKVFETFHNFVRKRKGGAALLNKQLLDEWNLRDDQIMSFTIAAFLYAIIRKNNMVKNFNLVDRGLFDRSLITLKILASGFSFKFLDLISSYDILKRLVVENEYKIEQNCSIPASNVISKGFVLDAWFNNTQLGGDGVCPVCDKIEKNPGAMGEQIVICQHKPSMVDFNFTDDIRTKFLTELLDTNHDHDDLKRVKDRCREKMPKTKFIHRCMVMHIKGGPGVGKSRLIRLLIDMFGAVGAPFTKLAKDYQKKEDQPKEIIFKTNHRLVDILGVKYLFIDEFTAMDWRYVACCAYINKVQGIFLVGDMLQTSIQKEHGLFFGDMMDIDSLSTHILVKNFRNPVDSVAVCNVKLDYDLQAVPNKFFRSMFWIVKEDLERGYMEYYDVDKEIDVRVQIPETSKMQKLFFSNNTIDTVLGTKSGSDEKITVTANQGADEESCILYVGQCDKSLSRDKKQVRVALTRHKKQLFICCDDSTVAQDFKSCYDFTAVPMKDLIKMATASAYQVEKPEEIVNFKTTVEDYVSEKHVDGTTSVIGLFSSIKDRIAARDFLGASLYFSEFIKRNIRETGNSLIEFARINRSKLILFLIFTLFKFKFVRTLLFSLLGKVALYFIYGLSHFINFIFKFNIPISLDFSSIFSFLLSVMTGDFTKIGDLFSLLRIADVEFSTMIVLTGQQICDLTNMNIEEVLDHFMSTGDACRPLEEYSYMTGYCWLNVFKEEYQFHFAKSLIPMLPIFSLIINMFVHMDKINDISFEYLPGHIRPFFYSEPFIYKILRLIFPTLTQNMLINKLLDILRIKNFWYRILGRIIINATVGSFISSVSILGTNQMFNFITKCFSGAYDTYSYYSVCREVSYDLLNVFKSSFSQTASSSFLLGSFYRIGNYITDANFCRGLRFLFNNYDKVEFLTLSQQIYSLI